MKKYLWIGIAIVIIGLVWSGISSWLSRRGAEALVSGATGLNVSYDGSGNVSYGNESGSVSTKNQLPAGWPSDAPSYPGATISFSGQSNATANNPESGMGVTLTTTNPADRVVAYYKDSLTQQGWTITDDVTANGASVLAATKDTRRFSVSVNANEGQTTIVAALSNQTN